MAWQTIARRVRAPRGWRYGLFSRFCSIHLLRNVHFSLFADDFHFDTKNRNQKPHTYTRVMSLCITTSRNRMQMPRRRRWWWRWWRRRRLNYLYLHVFLAKLHSLPRSRDGYCHLQDCSFCEDCIADGERSANDEKWESDFAKMACRESNNSVGCGGKWKCEQCRIRQ